MFDSWVEKIPWRRAWQPTPVYLLGESHREKSLVGYSPWGRKEWDRTDVTEHTCKFKLSLKKNISRIVFLIYIHNYICLRLLSIYSLIQNTEISPYFPVHEETG